MADEKNKNEEKKESKPASAKTSPSAKASGDKPSFAPPETGLRKGKEEEPKQKKEEMKEKEVKTKAKLSSKLEEIAKKIEGLTALELSDLASHLEEKFGVSGQIVAPVPATTQTAQPAAPTVPGEAQATEKSSYSVILTGGGSNKLAVIKAVREIDQSLGLMDAKKLVESPPKEILKEVKKEDAEEAKKKIEDAGGKVELK